MRTSDLFPLMIGGSTSRKKRLLVVILFLFANKWNICQNEHDDFLFLEHFSSTMIDTLLSANTSISNRTTNQIDSIKTIIPANYQIILLSFAYGIISLLSVLGNSSIIYIVIHNRRMHSVTNYFICNLALADCLVACFAVPFQVRWSDEIDS